MIESYKMLCKTGPWKLQSTEAPLYKDRETLCYVPFIYLFDIWKVTHASTGFGSHDFTLYLASGAGVIKN